MTYDPAPSMLNHSSGNFWVLLGKVHRAAHFAHKTQAEEEEVSFLWYWLRQQHGFKPADIVRGQITPATADGEL